VGRLSKGIEVNWLGEIVSRGIRREDSVLDLGCGIMDATGRLSCKSHVGVDCFQPYLDRIGMPFVYGTLPEAAAVFAAGSFDVVLLLDIVEHLEKEKAILLIAEAERIAAREVIVFTPNGNCPQRGYDAWGLGDNAAQAHRCEFTKDELKQLGYECGIYSNGSTHSGPVESVLGIKQIKCPSIPV